MIDSCVTAKVCPWADLAGGPAVEPCFRKTVRLVYHLDVSLTDSRVTAEHAQPLHLTAEAANAGGRHSVWMQSWGRVAQYGYFQVCKPCLNRAGACQTSHNIRLGVLAIHHGHRLGIQGLERIHLATE